MNNFILNEIFRSNSQYNEKSWSRSTMLCDFVTSCVEKVARKENFTEFTVESTTGSKRGDNFLGVMTAKTVSEMKVKNGIQAHDTLHLICKSPPLSEIRKKDWGSALVFKREIYTYSKLLPSFMRFQREKVLSEEYSFSAFPNIFMCEFNEENDSYILIMEDLKARNFIMWPKGKLISLDHQLLVLRELAKFHAISFAMKDQRRDEFSEYMQVEDLIFDVLINGSLRKFCATILDRTIEELINVEHKNVMANFRQMFLEKMKYLLKELPKTETSVMLHGDCWNNNFLFQYSGENDAHLNGICFVDWQLTHYGSPAIDVLYNIYTSTDKEFRDQHYGTLLKTYYTSLSETIRKLGSNPDKLYPYKHFQMQLEKFSEYALFYAPIITTLRLADEKDVMDVDEYAERLANGEDVDLMQKFTGKTQKVWRAIVNGAVTDLLQYGQEFKQTVS